MKKLWPQLRLFLLGMVPLIPGYILDQRSELIREDMGTARVLIGAAILLFSLAAARRESKNTGGIRLLVLFNAFGFVMLALLCVQLLGPGDYWSNFAGDLTRWYFLPVSGVSRFLLAGGGAYEWMAPMAGFFMQVLLSAIGGNVRLMRRD